MRHGQSRGSSCGALPNNIGGANVAVMVCWCRCMAFGHETDEVEMTNEMTRVDVWFDPTCPWAWMTTRWLTEAAQLRQLDLRWHVMSLSVLNEGRDELPADYRARMDRAWAPARVLTAARLAVGDGVLEPLYEAMGRRIHLSARSDFQAVISEALAELDLDPDLAEAGVDDRVDRPLRESHQQAMDLVGEEVGTPVIAVDGVGYFGPVVSPAPTGEDAARLWDGLSFMMSVPGFFELKRSRDVGPVLE